MTRHLWLLVLLLLTGGCATETFAGFTFGGGGNTFSAAPARFSENEQEFLLEAGHPNDASYLKLTCQGPVPEDRREVPVASVVARVPDREATDVVEGALVVQARQGDLVHGSFDLEVKAEDGRRFKVVGSFTARTDSGRATPSP